VLHKTRTTGARHCFALQRTHYRSRRLSAAHRAVLRGTAPSPRFGGSIAGHQRPAAATAWKIADSTRFCVRVLKPTAGLRGSEAHRYKEDFELAASLGLPVCL